MADSNSWMFNCASFNELNSSLPVEHDNTHGDITDFDGKFWKF